MGLFTKTADVTVHNGQKNMLRSFDGRYDKQVKKRQQMEKKLLKNLKLSPHTAREVCDYIENTYAVDPLPAHDERYKDAYAGVKAHLAEEYAEEALQSWDMEERFREAQQVTDAEMPLDFHVYSIPIRVNSLLLAWLEVYVEVNHEYLAFSTINLEDGDHFLVGKTIKDIVDYFSVTPEDIKERTERYIQFISMQ